MLECTESLGLSVIAVVEPTLIWGLAHASVGVSSAISPKLRSTPMGLPLPPVFLTSRDETQTMVHAKVRPKLRPRHHHGKEKLRPWSNFLGRENSDHGPNIGLPGGGGRSCLDDQVCGLVRPGQRRSSPTTNTLRTAVFLRELVTTNPRSDPRTPPRKMQRECPNNKQIL